MIQSSRGAFAWAHYPTASNPSGADHFERLIGKRGIREELEQGKMDVARVPE